MPRKPNRLESTVSPLAQPIAKVLTAQRAAKRIRGGSVLVPGVVGVASAAVLLGVAIGLVVSPENGKELRHLLATSIESFRDELIASLERLGERA